MFCSVLQFISVFCIAIQNVTVCCSEFSGGHVDGKAGLLQCVAVWFRVLQSFAVCCSTMQSVAVDYVSPAAEVFVEVPKFAGLFLFEIVGRHSVRLYKLLGL